MDNSLRILLRAGQTLLWLLFATPLCFAQVQYANSIVSAQNAGFVEDDYKAVDGDLTTNATIAPFPLLGFTRLRMSFPVTAQANQPAGLYLRPNNPLLNLALVGTTLVNTYLKVGNTTTAVESFTLSSSLVNLSVLSGGIKKATFTPTKQFNQVEFVFFSVLAIGQDIGVFEAYSTPVAPLPVVLTAFQGKATAAGVSLTWETASESKTSHFVVERTTAAEGKFQAIGRVASAGTSTQARQYQLLDVAPEQLNYYRLRQVDLDGTESFSPVVVVRMEPAENTLAAYPNPASDLLTVRGPVGNSFIVIDQTGRKVGGATISNSRLPQLDVRNWPAGLYFVRDAATGKSTKFVKATVPQ